MGGISKLESPPASRRRATGRWRAGLISKSLDEKGARRAPRLRYSRYSLQPLHLLQLRAVDDVEEVNGIADDVCALREERAGAFVAKTRACDDVAR